MPDISKISVNSITYDICDTSKAVPSTSLSLTLSSGSWSSATPPTQSKSASGVTSSNNVVVGLASSATSEQYNAMASGKIHCTAQSTNSLTFTCYGDKPTVNIPISVVILG